MTRLTRLLLVATALVAAPSVANASGPAAVDMDVAGFVPTTEAPGGAGLSLKWGGQLPATQRAAGARVEAPAAVTTEGLSLDLGGDRPEFVYAMSLGVDFGHVVAGTLIQSDGLGELLPPEIADFGPSMVTRGALLLGLDAVLFAANTIQEDVLMSDMRERFAELPPRMRRPHLSSKRRLVF